VLDQRQAVKDRMNRLAQLAKITKRPRQMFARLVQIAGGGELSGQQQARAGIKPQVGAGTLELDGVFDRRALDASTEAKLNARERGQALCEQSIVSCGFGKPQGTARVVLGGRWTVGELHDVGDVGVECSPEWGIVLGLVEGFAKALQRSIRVDRVLEHAAEA
jgi:hypothetical protein